MPATVIRAFRHRALASALVRGTGAAILSASVASAPAQAFIVFDPSNYAQNLLTAARALEQVNNEIRMLQNQAQSLINQAKNLTTISFPELQALNQTITQIDRLMATAQGITFNATNLDQQFKTLFPGSFNQALTNDQQVVAARNRITTAMAAYQQTMTVQAQVVQNVQADEATLAAIVARSQSAEGALQVGQATNQLLALVVKEEFQLQNLIAAQYRTASFDQASRTQARSDAQGAGTKFLGSGTAYTP